MWFTPRSHVLRKSTNRTYVPFLSATRPSSCSGCCTTQVLCQWQELKKALALRAHWGVRRHGLMTAARNALTSAPGIAGRNGLLAAGRRPERRFITDGSVPCRGRTAAHPARSPVTGENSSPDHCHGFLKFLALASLLGSAAPTTIPRTQVTAATAGTTGRNPAKLVTCGDTDVVPERRPMRLPRSGACPRREPTTPMPHPGRRVSSNATSMLLKPAPRRGLPGKTGTRRHQRRNVATPSVGSRTPR